MKNFFSKYLMPGLLLLSVALLGACSDDAETGGPAGGSQEGMFTLSLRSSAPVSRAGEPATAADDPFNEYLIESVDLYFYQGKLSGLDFDNAVPFYTQEVTVDATTTSELVVRIPMSKLDKNAISNFSVYAVANLSADDRASLEAISEKTVSAIKAMTVSSGFDKVSSAQPSFVMDGITDNITAGGAENSLVGTIELVRSSAKVSLNLNVPSTLEVDGVTYRSVTDGIVAFFNNGVKTSAIDTDASVAGFAPVSGSMFNSLDAVAFSTGSNAAFPLSLSVPFYTYPNSWRGTVTNDRRSYMLLCVPWQKMVNGVPSGQQENYYYQVPVNIEKTDGSNAASANMLERNKHYIVNLTVGKLGSPNKETPTDVEEKNLWYTVMDWGQENINVNLDKLRYLQVERDEYVMNATTEISIPFVSSHDVEIVDAYLTFKNYNTSGGTPLTYYIMSGTQVTTSTTAYRPRGTSNNIYELTVDSNSKSIKFSHDLMQVTASTTSSTSTSVRYTESSTQEAIGEFVLKFTVRHKDSPTTLETITVIQYPSLYITVEASPSRNYTKVNGKTEVAGFLTGTATWEGVHEGNASNNNNNNYIINVSRFSTTEYIIADPRVTSVNNLDFTFTNAPSLSENGTISTAQRGLENYYPTSSSADNKMMISPMFVVASSRGACGDMSQTNAKKRCAAYQENGRPAGRWRVPTYGEVKFMMELTAKGLIPRLFGSTGSGTTEYWIASGQASVSNGDANFSVSEKTTGLDNTAVRCVYDEWYWGDNKIPDANKGTFYWGDRKRSN